MEFRDPLVPGGSRSTRGSPNLLGGMPPDRFRDEDCRFSPHLLPILYHLHVLRRNPERSRIRSRPTLLFPEPAPQVIQAELFDASVVGVSSLEMGGDDHEYLRRRAAPTTPSGGREIRVADLFSGVGGISLGVREACTELGLRFRPVLAMDVDPEALACFVDNFAPSTALGTPIEELLSPFGAGALTGDESSLRDAVGPVDVLVGGPPCQGHSDLNNSTRRSDPKNALYLYMARAAEVLSPEHVLIENVVGALRDKQGVVQVTRQALESIGYRTSLGIVDLDRIGVPQTRRRAILLASKTCDVSVAELTHKWRTERRDLRWAISDIEDDGGESILDEPSKPSTANRARIEYLFANNLYDLPDSERPPCHRGGGHSYKSVYGRLRWDQPAQTITRGFYSTCMGRYVHPSSRRTLTAHEAARIQFFPDFFRFDGAGSRTTLARLIGNAVPPKLGFVTAHELLEGLSANGR